MASGRGSDTNADALARAVAVRRRALDQRGEVATLVERAIKLQRYETPVSTT